MTRPDIGTPGRVLSTTASAALHARARRVIPGGVNSSKRGLAPFLAPGAARGAYLVDVDGNTYLDLHGAYGAIVLGHSYEPMEARARELMDGCILPGIGVTELEVVFAEKLVHHIPCAEMVLAASTGTEATQHAIRLARGATGRRKILKFEGHYHGNHDSVLVNTWPTAEQLGRHTPSSPGVLLDTAQQTLIARFNDIASVQAAIDAHGHDIAAVIVEPIACNSPTIRPLPGFLLQLRRLCDHHGIVLIFDEVITGFRLALEGVHSLLGVTPDLATFGKAMANGHPAAALAGRADLMQQFNTVPDGHVWIGGTLNGGAAGLAPAVATIEIMESEQVFEHTRRLGEQLNHGLRAIAREAGIPITAPRLGGIFSAPLWYVGAHDTYDDIIVHNDQRFSRHFLDAWRSLGVLVVSEPMGRNHISYSVTPADIDWAVQQARKALRATLDELGAPQSPATD